MQHLKVEKDATVMQISTNYSGLRESFQEAPEVYLFLFSLLFGSVGYAYYRNEYGGYSGIYKPTELVEALTKEDNIIVVDIRNDEEQETNGILDLRRSARGKAVSLPLVEVRLHSFNSAGCNAVQYHASSFLVPHQELFVVRCDNHPASLGLGCAAMGTPKAVA
jgi:hypothetical protein